MKKLLLAAGILIATTGQAQQLKTENVFVITFDGLRWQEVFTGADPTLINDHDYVKDTTALKQQFWKNTAEDRRTTLLPFLWSTVKEKGQIYGNRNAGNYVNVKNKHWFSYPGYSEILVGHADSTINSNDKILNKHENILGFVNKQDQFKGKVAAFGSWDVFPFIINEAQSGIPVNAGFESSTDFPLTSMEKHLNTLQKEMPSPWSSVRLDAFTHHYAMEYTKKHQPRLLYIAYGETDDFAHDGKYDAYLKSAVQTDQFIKEFWEYIQSTPQYKNKTTLIITTDHGRGSGEPKEGWKHHGHNLKAHGQVYDIKGSDQIWMAVLGPDTPVKGEVKNEGQLFQNQIAATVGKFLGLEYKHKQEIGTNISEFLNKKNK